MIHHTTHITLLSVALAVFSVPALAQDEATALKQFKKQFRPKASAIAFKKEALKYPQGSGPYLVEINRRRDVVEAWNQAAQKLQGHSSANVAKAIATAWLKLDKEVVGLWKRHEKLEKRVAADYQKMIKANGGKPIGPRATRVAAKVMVARNAWFLSCRTSSNMQRDITDLSSLQDELRLVVAAMEKPEGPKWLLQKVVGDQKYPLLLKVTAIRAATAIGEGLLADLVAVLEQARRADVLAATLYGIAIYGAKAKAHSSKIVALLEHDDSGVREQAALALQHMKEAAAIEPMIKLIALETGQARLRIVGALEILTGKQFGANISAWQGWFAREGADYIAGNKPLGLGRPSQHRKFDQENYYYGIPQHGKGIIYVIDCSGSMIVDKDEPDWGDPDGLRDPRPAKDASNSRTEASKRELVRALSGLSSDQTFNIISYNHSAALFKKSMVHATPKNVAAAIEYTRKLPADSSTNIYEAMKLAFTLTGRGSYDRHYDVAFDTIFLMTDGKPTLQAVGDDDPMKIVKGVRQWNSLKRVVIHTIAMGDSGIDHKFMRMLANENKGGYRKILKGGKVVLDGADEADKKKDKDGEKGKDGAPGKDGGKGK